MKEKSYFAVVIGSGAAGLVVAKGLAKAGKKVLLVEKENWGGDCTNFGCIPSKTLIHLAKEVKTLHKYHCNPLLNNVFDTVRTTVERIKKEEEPEALSSDTLDTIEGEASFKDPHTITVNNKEFSAKYIVLATGAKPRIPQIKGIEKIPFYTNETIFSLTTPPKSLIILGGGPIGSELAQAFARLGTKVSIIQRPSHIVAKEPKEFATCLEKVFLEEGIDLHTNNVPMKLEFHNYKTHCHIKNQSTEEEKELIADCFLVAAGRVPSHQLLHLENAGIKYSEKGISVDKYGRTTQKHIYAIGDAVGPPFFTHKSENQARTVLSSLLLPWKIPFSKQAIPRVTFTDPEIASIGITDEEEIEKLSNIAIYDLPISKVDRAITQGEMDGMIRVITKKWSSKIIGAIIMAPRAGEMLLELSVAMDHKIPLRKLSSLIHPYPTYSLAIRQISDQWLTKTILPLFSKKR